MILYEAVCLFFCSISKKFYKKQTKPVRQKYNVYLSLFSTRVYIILQDGIDYSFLCLR